MNEIYPIFFVLISFLLGVYIFVSSKTKNGNIKMDTPENATKEIDKLINNSNTGICVIEYREALRDYEFVYDAWRVKRNESTEK